MQQPKSGWLVLYAEKSQKNSFLWNTQELQQKLRGKNPFSKVGNKVYYKTGVFYEDLHHWVKWLGEGISQQVILDSSLVFRHSGWVKKKRVHLL